MQLLTELYISQHWKKGLQQSSDSISADFRTPNITMEVINHNRRKKKVATGWGDNISILSGVWQYGKGEQKDTGVAMVPLEIVLFSDPVYIGLTSLITFLVQKTMRAKIERIDRS